MLKFLYRVFALDVNSPNTQGLKMHKTIKQILIGATVVAFTACGEGESTSGGPSSVSFGNNTVGILQFGLLKNTKVEIYALSPDGEFSKQPLFTETTTDGNIKNAGRFNTHSSELEDKTYYVYRYNTNNSIDIDFNLDGKEDKGNDNLKASAAELNKQTMEVLIRGEWLKQLGGKAFRMTPLSFVITDNVDYKGRGTSGLSDKFNDVARRYIQTDINGDGNIDIKDALIYNPLTDLKKTKGAYRDVIREFEIFFKKSMFYDEETFLIAPKYTKVVGALNIGCRYDSILQSDTVLRDDTVAIAHGEESLIFVDISDPIEMSKISEIPKDYTLLSFSKSSHNIVYALTGRSIRSYRTLNVLDISDASSPKIISNKGSSKTDILSYMFSADMQQLYFLTTSGKGTKTYFDIYDLSDERQPKLIGRTKVNNFMDTIYLSKEKNKLYLASEDRKDRNSAYIHTVDISDPNNLIITNPIKYKGKRVNLIPDYIDPLAFTTDKKLLVICDKGKITAKKKP